MACPFRGAAQFVPIRHDLFKLGIDPIIGGRALSRKARCGKSLKPDARRGIADQNPPQRRDHKQKAQTIGEKSRQDQQQAPQQDQRPMRQRRNRIAHLVLRPLQIAQHPHALPAHQPRPQHPRQQHNRQCRPQRQPTANGDKKGNLDQRHRQKQRKNPHRHGLQT